MGQFSTYKKSELQNQLAELERELIAIKTPQVYSGDQIQYRKSNIVSLTCNKHWADPEKTMRMSNDVLARLRFTGIYPDQVAIGSLMPTVRSGSGGYVNCRHRTIKKADNNAKNSFDLLLWALCDTNKDTVDFYCQANMAGKLEVVEYYDTSFIWGPYSG